MSSRAAALVNRSARAAAISSFDADGATYRAAAPHVSRATAVSRTSGGTPAASASSGVSPNPSYSERNANTEARRYSDARTASSTYERMLMRSACLHPRRIESKSTGRLRAILANDLELSIAARDRQRDRKPGSTDRLGAAGITNRRTARSEHDRQNDRLERSFVERSIPSGITRTFLMPMWRAISAFENSLSVMTASCAAGGPGGEQSPARAFTEREPFRMGEERQVVNREDQGSRHGQWSSVPRREEHIGLHARNGARQRQLFPDRAAATSSHFDARRPARRAFDRARSDQRPLVPARRVAPRPGVEQTPRGIARHRSAARRARARQWRRAWTSMAD